MRRREAAGWGGTETSSAGGVASAGGRVVLGAHAGSKVPLLPRPLIVLLTRTREDHRAAGLAGQVLAAQRHRKLQSFEVISRGPGSSA